MKISSLRSSTRNLPLKVSLCPFSHGLPGSSNGISARHSFLSKGQAEARHPLLNGFSGFSLLREADIDLSRGTVPASGTSLITRTGAAHRPARAFPVAFSPVLSGSLGQTRAYGSKHHVHHHPKESAGAVVFRRVHEALERQAAAHGAGGGGQAGAQDDRGLAVVPAQLAGHGRGPQAGAG